MEDFKFAIKQLVVKGIGEKLPMTLLLLLTLMGKKGRNKFREEVAKRILDRGKYAVKTKQDEQDDVAKYALDIEETTLGGVPVVIWSDL